MHEEQKEILRQKIYNTLCYTCSIGPSEFSPEILINYSKYEQLGKCADDLTYEHIPEALGIISSYELPFANNIYFRDSGTPITFIIDLFKPEKNMRPPLTAKYHMKKKIISKKIFVLLMRTLSIQEQDFSPDIVINEGVYKLSGRKAKRFIHQTALYLPLSCDEVYKHFQEKEYFNLPTPIITWIMMTLFSPCLYFCNYNHINNLFY